MFSILAFVHCSGASAVKFFHTSVKYSVPVKISLHQNKKKTHGPLSAGILQGLHERHYYLNNCSYNKHFVNIFSIVYPNIWSLMLSLPQIVMNIEKSYNILLLNFKRWRTIVNNKKNYEN